MVEEIKKTKEAVTEEQDQKEFISKKVDKIEKENVKFVQTLKDRDDRINDLKSKL
jgi:hypothetical protein